MSSTPKRNFTAKTTRPVIDATSLYGMDEVPASSSVPDADTKSVAPVTPTEAMANEWVQFSTYLHRKTYLRLKQAEYWEPGFVVRQQIEQVVSELLDKLESANKSLPEEQLQKLLQKNKKLQS
ncbi:hypothetical protein [Hymenobacter gelipurpurascens]|uniref:hypothetical protein n=1 Tax=Hymenobacter gelipurpurascens TaxID=89968 RepID=UPI001131373D|nr:hypothetical protein [Hymenobacter gelipurpurascens]